MLKAYPTTDFSLPWFDFSTLNATEACPRKAVIQYRHNKHMPDSVVGKALDAGTHMHKFFAAWNAYEKEHLLNSFTTLEIENMYAAASLADENEKRLTFALSTLNDYEDDYNDSRRTLEKLQGSAVFWSEMQTHRYTVLGVEKPFDITLEIDLTDSPIDTGNDINPIKIRYVGVIDAIMTNQQGKSFNVEYKTTSRITDAYRSQWILSNQLTGYNLAMRTLYPDLDVLHGSMLEAITIPIPKKPGIAPIHMRELYERNEVHFDIFANFVYDGVLALDLAMQSPTDAKANTHSCTDYNTACTYLRLCAMNAEDRKIVFEDEMIERVWNPTITV